MRLSWCMQMSFKVAVVAVFCLSFGRTSLADGFQVEVGTVTLRDTIADPNSGFDSVSFTNSFDDIPLIFALPTDEGGDPSAIRIQNVTTAGFEIIHVEPSAVDGRHIAMTNVPWIAITPGEFLLADGTQVAALRQTGVTAFQAGGAVAGEGWATASFDPLKTFSSAPVVLAQIQTMTSESQSPPFDQSVPFLTVAIRNGFITSSSVQFALERSESTAGSISGSGETVGILAMDAGQFSLLEDGFGTVLGEATLSPTNVTGDCIANTYSRTYSAAPIMVASPNSHFGGDGGWPRLCSSTGTTYTIQYDEDTDSDTERNHTTEALGVIAFDQAFTADYYPDITVSSTDVVSSDPLGQTTYQVPGSIIEITVDVDNQGLGRTSDGSTVVTVDIPVGTAMIVVDIGGANSGPVLFQDPDTDSGLSYSFGVPLETSDGLEFFDDGTLGWNYQPTADTFGTDVGVTRFRITFGSRFSGYDGTDIPEFNIVYRLRIQ